MKVAYFDAFSGIAGDMTLGALLHLGAPLEGLRAVVGALGLTGVEVATESRTVNGIRALKLLITDRAAAGRHGHRAFADIRAQLAGAALAPRVRERALAVFTALAGAEGRVHGVAPEDVHFHEVGAVDSLVDIVGTAFALDALAIEEIYASVLPLGRGLVRSRHGALPVPSPAAVELLRDWPVRAEDGEGELVTPTGAALVAALARPGPPPDLRIAGVGYGCGERVLADRPNVLRVIVGEPVVAAGHDEVVCLEANIDDLNPELYDYAMERLFAAGAKDVFLAPVQMKKGRPGTLLRVLGAPADRDRLAAVIFQETSTIGVRYATARRLTLARETVRVETAYGTLAVKVARGPAGEVNVAPEYEACRRAAEARGVPLKVVYQAALAAYASGSPRPR